MKNLKKFIFNLLISIQKNNCIPVKLRRLLLIAGGIEVGKGAIIASGVDFKTSNVCIGENALVNKNCHLYAGKVSHIRIGVNTQLAYDVLIATQTHQIGSQEKRAGNCYESDVVIGDGCWIGMGAKILPGVTIGRGCVVGGGTVVVKNTDDNAMYLGVPAEKARILNEDLKKSK